MLSATMIEAAREYHRLRNTRHAETLEAERLHWLDVAQTAIQHTAPNFPAVERVYLFGSIVHPQRFHSTSDIDVAVDCTDVEQESLFWRALERLLQRDVDLRPNIEPISWSVQQYGEVIYEREDASPAE